MNTRSVKVVEMKCKRGGRKRPEPRTISVPTSPYNGNRKGIRLDAEKELERLTKRQFEPT